MGKARVTLINNLQFVGTADSGHAVVMDAPGSVGGTNAASTPMELVLMAFGGCSGMDVVSILKKKKQDVRNLEINLDGKKADNHPHMFTEMHIEYVLTGKDLSEEAVKRSIQLSLEKYCSVGATLSKAAKITHSYRIVKQD
ncbi:hypothetical protein BMS3Abin10_00909 [bacterium BMS3Abin10]|nr:hypothetical protein BMS3Abin10_00909 [bacterium BMS3Abin10]GBE37665.1 hypothetical protein BMS3Bbin08_00256 [bacterium BMS3Bbin08]HDH50018.1 OsmC family protein [Nitrospirota bacterium]HDK17377.1 OsmC family protein [Nitrospirota bacterium]